MSKIINKPSNGFAIEGKIAGGVVNNIFKHNPIDFNLNYYQQLFIYYKMIHRNVRALLHYGSKGETSKISYPREKCLKSQHI